MGEGKTSWRSQGRAIFRLLFPWGANRIGGPSRIAASDDVVSILASHFEPRLLSSNLGSCRTEGIVLGEVSYMELRRLGNQASTEGHRVAVSRTGYCRTLKG
jgi:hypothetical protein